MYYIFFPVKMGLLFVMQSSYVQRIDFDGSNRVTLFTGGNPIAVDYDYRLDIQQITPSSFVYIIVFRMLLLSYQCFYDIIILQEELLILVGHQLSTDLERTI